MRLILIFLGAVLAGTRILACDLALLLAVDVSGSVDRREFSIQMIGLAEAIRDPTIADALVAQNAHLALLQWTGASRQDLTIGWTEMRSQADVTDFAARVEADPRVWRNYSTAIGEALIAAENAFSLAPECRRKVVDVSGDGISNEGIEPSELRRRLRQANITVNALAIETDDTDLTAYLFEHVIGGPGAFVFTANGFEDYPDQIRRKLEREVLDRYSEVSRPELRSIPAASQGRNN